MHPFRHKTAANAHGSDFSHLKCVVRDNTHMNLPTSTNIYESRGRCATRSKQIMMGNEKNKDENGDAEEKQFLRFLSGAIRVDK